LLGERELLAHAALDHMTAPDLSALFDPTVRRPLDPVRTFMLNVIQDAWNAAVQHRPWSVVGREVRAWVLGKTAAMEPVTFETISETLFPEVDVEMMKLGFLEAYVATRHPGRRMLRRMTADTHEVTWKGRSQRRLPIEKARP